jgi:hypothetical protein
VKLFLAWLCVVPLALAQWVYEHKKLVRAMMGLLAVAVLVAVCTGCPVWERPACGSPRAYQCVNNQPHVCSPSQRLTPIGDEPCPGACVVSDAGVAFCAPVGVQ